VLDGLSLRPAKETGTHKTDLQWVHLQVPLVDTCTTLEQAVNKAPDKIRNCYYENNKTIVKDCIATCSIKFRFDLAEKVVLRQLYVACIYLFFWTDGAKEAVLHYSLIAWCPGPPLVSLRYEPSRLSFLSVMNRPARRFSPS
jgi:hypothetical protein